MENRVQVKDTSQVEVRTEVLGSFEEGSLEALHMGQNADWEEARTLHMDRGSVEGI